MYTCTCVQYIHVHVLFDSCMTMSMINTRQGRGRGREVRPQLNVFVHVVLIIVTNACMPQSRLHIRLTLVVFPDSKGILKD